MIDPIAVAQHPDVRALTEPTRHGYFALLAGGTLRTIASVRGVLRRSALSSADVIPELIDAGLIIEEPWPVECGGTLYELLTPAQRDSALIFQVAQRGEE